jgi:hypothetical protein
MAVTTIDTDHARAILALVDAQAAEIARLREAIKTQASAVRMLQANEQTEINILRKQRNEWHHAVSSLDSEREANALLTAEIERLRGVIRQAIVDGDVKASPLPPKAALGKTE